MKIKPGMEKAYKEKDENYTFVSWEKDKIDKIILMLKQKRDKMFQT